MRILVVEDEKRVAAFIRRGLEEEAYVVDVTGNGLDAEYFAQTRKYDLLVLDLMLPGRDGVEVCRNLRSHGVTTPILMLTARGNLDDKIEGLDSGADDYLTKPFAFEEFLARVRALLRRGPANGAVPLRIADLVLDRARRQVRRGDRQISLSNKEYALLEFFLSRPGRVLSRSVIAAHVWGINFDSESNVIDVTVSHLRQKLDRGEAVPLIRTVRGAGYVLSEEAP